VTFDDPEGLFSYRRPHRRTGRPPGPPPGSQNNWKHGRRSAAFVEGRKALNALIRQAREAVAAARQAD
jgi:hypothetical protein